MNERSASLAPPKQRILLYGATGYTGQRVARRLVAEGVDVVLAARNAQALSSLARTLRVPWVEVSLDQPARLDQALSTCGAVLHAAGPFVKTAEPMMMAALRCGVHYLDLAGEWPVFTRAQQLDRQAIKAGVMMMPGVGFTIVASDCLLKLVAQQHRQIRSLRLAISRPDQISAGTLRSMLGLVDETVLVRRNGALTSKPVGSLWHTFDFGHGTRRALAVNWPDVVTAEFTTGVPTIETFAEVNGVDEDIYRLSALAAPLLSIPVVNRSLGGLTNLFTPSTRQTSHSSGFVLVVEAVDQWRRTFSRRLQTSDGYTVTVDTVAAVVRHVLNGVCQAGFMTPARLLGTALIDECPSMALMD